MKSNTEYAWYQKDEYCGLLCGPGIRSLVGHALYLKQYDLALLMLQRGFLPGYTRIVKKKGHGIATFNNTQLLEQYNDYPADIKDAIKPSPRTYNFDLETEYDKSIKKIFYVPNMCNAWAVANLKTNPHWHLLRDYNGNTIAHYIAQQIPNQENTAQIKCILQYPRIDWNAKNFQGYTPFDTISCPQTIDDLLSNNVQYDIPISFDQKISVLFRSIKEKDIPKINALLKHISLFQEDGHPVEYQGNNFSHFLIDSQDFHFFWYRVSQDQETWYQFIKQFFETICKQKNGTKHLHDFLQTEKSKPFIDFAANCIHPDIKLLLVQMGAKKDPIEKIWKTHIEKFESAGFAGAKCYDNLKRHNIEQYKKLLQYKPENPLEKPFITQHTSHEAAPDPNAYLQPADAPIPSAPPSDVDSNQSPTNSLPTPISQSQDQTEFLTPTIHKNSNNLPHTTPNRISSFFQSLRKRVSYVFAPALVTNFFSRTFIYFKRIFL